MADLAGDSIELFHGQPCRCLRLPNGDSLRVALHGAQVVSWVAGGRERLYLSPRSSFDGKAAIRGGVPICFPQFNQRGPLPKHGFARNLSWRVDVLPDLSEQAAELTLHLSSSESTTMFWPQSFEATLTLHLRPASLQMTLAVSNTGDASMSFTGALHTYLAVKDIAAVQLDGLRGRPEWDALTDQHSCVSGALNFHGEFDRVYGAPAQALILNDGADRLVIEQSRSFADTVVWNPGADKCASLSDMPADGYAHMLCVEAAQVMQPVTLEAGAQWQGWQRLSVL
jgi:glucose-6-phosphate 1-epimerase